MISLAAGLTLRRNVLSGTAVDHIVGLVPADEAAWTPCIGQVEDFASKRCTLIPVDADVQRSLAAISTTFGVDTSALDMLPIIRYLPGAPPVGVHGDVGAAGDGNRRCSRAARGTATAPARAIMCNAFACEPPT